MATNKAVLSQLGIKPQEIVLIKSIFKLVKWIPTIYEFKKFDPKVLTEVLIVDADNMPALQHWRQLKGNNIAHSIMISEQGQNIKNTLTLQRPINIKNFTKKLEGIASTDSVHELYENIISESIKILIVDDSLSVHKYMEHRLPLLCNNRIEISYAETGQEAARKVKNNIYDIVFLDVVMPGVDGYKVCKWIKANSIAEVVMLTSKGSRFDKVRGAMSGCDTYLTKPPQDRKLKEILEKRSKLLLKNNNHIVKTKRA